MLTADVTVANNGLGNLVDLEHGVVRVRVQATTRVERKELPFQVGDAADAIESLITDGLEKTQQRFNS